MLQVDHLTRRFGGLVAVNDLSFSVAKGEILGVMGANGAGKTTLFSLLAGNTRPSAGRIVVDGVEAGHLPPDRLNRLGVARTFQIVRPFNDLTVLDNVATAVLFGRHRERSRDRAAERARAILDEVGLEPQADVPARSLTLAGRKRLELARALATDPKLLLLDEILAGLTGAEVAAALDLIRRLHERYGLTILVVEHVMRALMRLSDRVLVMHHGCKIAEGLPDAVAADHAVIAAYFGAAPHAAASHAA